MARGRKSEKIKVLTHRDIKLLKQLSRTGISNRQQTKEYCNINDNRIKQLEKSGYIKISEHIVRGSNLQIIQLNKAGKEYCRQEEGTYMFCKAQTNHLEHDLKLTEIYYNLKSEIQDTWRHEGELIKEIYEKFLDQEGKLQTCVDATVEVAGEIIAIESIGSSYTGADIELKETIAVKYLGCNKMERV